MIYDSIETRILSLRGHRVILDSALANLYGISTKRLNEQVKRNRDRFPEDFMFSLSDQEVSDLRSQIATSKEGRGGRRYRPFAFTEHGAVMAANVVHSPTAISASIVLVRVFVKLRHMVIEHGELKHRLIDLERKLAKGFAEHEEELRELRFMIAALHETPLTKKSRIGF